MSNEDVGLNFARGSVEQKEALQCTHVYVQMHCLYNDVGLKKGFSLMQKNIKHYFWVIVRKLRHAC